MLDKLKVAALVAVALQTLNIIYPNLGLPVETLSPLVAQVVIALISALTPIAAGYATKERKVNLEALVTR